MIIVNLATKSSNNIYSEILFARIIIGVNRINLSLSYAYSYKQESVVTKQRSATIYKEFEQDKTKNMGMGWPKNPNEFIDYLTDTIVLTQSNDPEKTMDAGEGGEHQPGVVLGVVTTATGSCPSKHPEGSTT